MLLGALWLSLAMAFGWFRKVQEGGGPCQYGWCTN